MKLIKLNYNFYKVICYKMKDNNYFEYHIYGSNSYEKLVNIKNSVKESLIKDKQNNCLFIEKHYCNILSVFDNKKKIIRIINKKPVFGNTIYKFTYRTK